MRYNGAGRGAETADNVWSMSRDVRKKFICVREPAASRHGRGGGCSSGVVSGRRRFI